TLQPPCEPFIALATHTLGPPASTQSKLSGHGWAAVQVRVQKCRLAPSSNAHWLVGPWQSVFWVQAEPRSPGLWPSARTVTVICCELAELPARSCAVPLSVWLPADTAPPRIWNVHGSMVEPMFWPSSQRSTDATP